METKMDPTLDIFDPRCNYGVLKVFCWLNSDLDGVGSTILLGNMFRNFEYRHCFFRNFQEQYLKWKENAQDYEKIFIVGMVLDQAFIKKIDDERVIIVSDRTETYKTIDSTVIQEECGSCTKLLYKKFKDRVNFTTDLKKLFVYINDYNSYDLKHDETTYLNALYRKSGGNRFVNFVNRFWNGYDGLTDTEVAMADTFFEELKSEINDIALFKGEWEGKKVISAVSKFSVNELAGFIMDNEDVDVVIVANPSTQFVSFRKARGSDVDIAKMATILCEGGGGEWASGGKMTKQFLEFSQTLEQL